MDGSSSDPSPAASARAQLHAERVAWTPERHAELQVLAADGKTGAEIARLLGTTRSAILGRAHRTGAKLPMDARKKALLGHSAPRPAKRRGYAPDHPLLRSRPKGARAFSDAQIAVAIAARLAGQSFSKSARLVGAGAQVLSRFWIKNPDLLALGRALYERARADAAMEAARKREIAAFEAEATRLHTERTNAPILAMMPERARLICERRIAGETLQQVGQAFGITRERVRQIEAKWRLRGLIVPGANPLSEATVRTFAPGARRPATVKPPVDFYAAAHKALGPKRRRNLSDAERQRRADCMREVARRRWEVRA